MLEGDGAAASESQLAGAGECGNRLRIAGGVETCRRASNLHRARLAVHTCVVVKLENVRPSCNKSTIPPRKGLSVAGTKIHLVKRQAPTAQVEHGGTGSSRRRAKNKLPHFRDTAVDGHCTRLVDRGGTVPAYGAADLAIDFKCSVVERKRGGIGSFIAIVNSNAKVTAAVRRRAPKRTSVDVHCGVGVLIHADVVASTGLVPSEFEERTLVDVDRSAVHVNLPCRVNISLMA